MDRFFEYGELPLVLLALLSQGGPKSGFELMGELADLFSPRYNPSAGSVYPALVALEKEELVAESGSGVPKRYHVTKAGEDSLEIRLEELGWIERRTGAFIRPEGSVDGELDRLVGLVRQSRGKVDPKKVTNILEQAQSELQALTHRREGREG